MPPEFSKRKSRFNSHRPPSWVSESAVYFITINCQNRKENKLTLKETSAGLLDSFRYYQDLGKWHVSLILLMPDHLHALLSFNHDAGAGMARLIRNWKRYTAREYMINWQRDYFDHRIRNQADMEDKWNYIRENPVRAGYVTSYEEWPHVLRGDGTRGW